MKTHFLLVILHCSLLVTAQSDTRSHERYSRISIEDPDASAISIILKAGIDLSCGNHQTKIDGAQTLQIECSQNELEALRQQGLKPTILIEDVSSFYAQRSERNLGKARDALSLLKHEDKRRSENSTYCVPPEYPVPVHFVLGDMGGFLYYQQILDMLDSMAASYPDLISIRKPLSESLTTIEGRQVYWVKISDHPDIDEAEPEVLYTALTHAREPASAMTLLYYMWYLLENYESDPQIQRIVDLTELYFVPVVNPDGYIYNETTAPQGGGMWRKNLRDNDANDVIDENDGVDLNRNFGFQWGLDDIGSSPKPTYSTYRGEAPFSEPETRMLRDFTLQREFVSAMHDHSYGKDLYYPWDHGHQALPDSGYYYRLSDLMSWHNRYHFGESHRTYWLGAVNGGANDWFYGAQKEKPKILSWIPEIGKAFWPNPTEIVSLCMQQMEPHIVVAKSAAQLAMIHDLSSPALGHGMNTITFRIENLGVHAGDFNLTLVPIGSDITDFYVHDDGRIQLEETLESTEITVDLEIDSRAPDGSVVEFELVLEAYDYAVVRSRIAKFINPLIRLQDEPDIDDLGIWESELWGTSIDSTHPGRVCITDSPGSNQLNEFNTIKLKEGIDLSNVSWAKATFLARWSIETKHDYVQLQGRSESGAWMPLCGKYSKPGVKGYDIDVPSPFAGQPAGEPVYDGRQSFWISEEVDLSDFTGMDNVELRFVAWSGGMVSLLEEDGFYFADFKIYTSRHLHCANQQLDPGEDGIDCGGEDCAPCVTCTDGILNGDEESVDCGGGSCAPCPSCTDGVQNSDEEGIDCGGESCAPCPSCSDGIQNSDEEGIDCGGGSCAPCPTCADGIQNGNETGVDCGGPLCTSCAPTCTDGILNGDEEDVDCGGSCPTICKTYCCDRETKIWYNDSGLAITLGPNPVRDKLSIAAEWEGLNQVQNFHVLRWDIMNLAGTPVDHGEIPVDSQLLIDVSHLVPQIYLIRISDAGGGVIVERFLKQD